MTDRATAELAATVLDSRDPRGLAEFYQQLLGWVRVEDGETWVRIGPPDDLGPGLSFQLEPEQLPATWPTQVGSTQMQTHLDLRVEELQQAVARAVSLGARAADHQPQDGVKVMFDPAGHVFCLFTPGH